VNTEQSGIAGLWRLSGERSLFVFHKQQSYFLIKRCMENNYSDFIIQLKSSHVIYNLV